MQNIDEQPKQSVVPVFQMNRTLTGSTSARIASSNERDAELQSPRARAHHLINLRRRLGLLFALAVIGGVVLLIIVNNVVASVRIDSSVNPDRAKAYQTRVEAYLDGRPFERLLFWLNSDQLTAYIQEKYPEVATVHMARQGDFGNATATIRLRAPIARWLIDGQNNYVDGTGTVFSYTVRAIPRLQIIDNSGVPTTGSSSVASASFLEFVGRLAGDLEQYGYTMDTATIPADSIREIDITISSVSYRFKTTTDRSVGNQAQDISRIIPYLKQRGVQPQYVDVRLDQEAFYK